MILKGSELRGKYKVNRGVGQTGKARTRDGNGPIQPAIIASQAPAYCAAASFPRAFGGNPETLSAQCTIVSLDA